MMNIKLLYLIIATCAMPLVNAQDPNPQLFQTWYLYSESVDLGDPQYFYGENVPQMTINEDLSFSAIDNCWDISGVFEYMDGDGNYDLFLLTTNYDEECVLGGSTGYTLKLVYDEQFPVGGYIFEGSPTELYLEYAAGFGLSFRNEITLSVPENMQDQFVIAPNPVRETISISGVSAPVDRVQIMNSTGRIVKEYKGAHLSTVDVSQLAKGLYFLRIDSQGNSTLRKFLKE